MRNLALLSVSRACALGVVFACSCSEPPIAQPAPAAYEAEAGAPLTCVPNLDGMITSNELAPSLGIPESFLVSPLGQTRTVDLDGTMNASGQITWDWSTSYADDGADQVEAEPIAGRWYAASFPNAQFVLPYDAAHTLEAIYSHDDQALWLYGLASATQSPAEGQTLYAYAAPVALYKFPFGPGSTSTSVGQVMNGTLLGLPYAATDTYVTTDDAIGTMILPDFTFTQVHRVRTNLTNAPVVGATSTTRQVSFIFECFGEVARATSQTNEPNVDFTTAAEQRRLGATP